MSEFCFVLVDGITKSLSSGEGNIAIAGLLRRWFPKSHCHYFDTFSEAESLSTGSDILEERGRSLLKILIQYPVFSTIHRDGESTGGSQYIERSVVFIGHDIGGSVIKRVLVLANENWPSWRITETALAVFFFGCLHRATETDSWERQIMSLLSASQRDVQTIFPLLPSLATSQAVAAQDFLGSWGYHGNSGLTLGIQKLAGSAQFGEAYKEGDTVGCGVNFEKETAFFTKNGKLIGPAFYGIKGKLYPAVSFDVQSPGAAITANFGSDEFLYKEWESEENTTRNERNETNALYESDLDSEWEWGNLLR